MTQNTSNKIPTPGTLLATALGIASRLQGQHPAKAQSCQVEWGTPRQGSTVKTLDSRVNTPQGSRVNTPNRSTPIETPTIRTERNIKMTVGKTTSTLDRNKQKKTHFPYRTELPRTRSTGPDRSHGRTLLFKHQRAWPHYLEKRLQRMFEELQGRVWPEERRRMPIARDWHGRWTEEGLGLAKPNQKWILQIDVWFAAQGSKAAGWSTRIRPSMVVSLVRAGRDREIDWSDTWIREDGQEL